MKFYFYFTKINEPTLLTSKKNIYKFQLLMQFIHFPLIANAIFHLLWFRNVVTQLHVTSVAKIHRGDDLYYTVEMRTSPDLIYGRQVCHLGPSISRMGIITGCALPDPRRDGILNATMKLSCSAGAIRVYSVAKVICIPLGPARPSDSLSFDVWHEPLWISN